jgi:hypothetical protein
MRRLREGKLSCAAAGAQASATRVAAAVNFAIHCLNMGCLLVGCGGLFF